MIKALQREEKTSIILVFIEMGMITRLRERSKSLCVDCLPKSEALSLELKLKSIKKHILKCHTLKRKIF